ncbi:MAG TPA: ATP-binding protein [Acetobacteraceae bacterium]|jgi:C4-dicarboxylate-specific signal transduction histidine kinase|nr:ATP-binding protein [Acetobacteraceae bacterium]
MALDTDASRLRLALRDLVALSSIPAVWVGKAPGTVGAEFVDMLVDSLHLDFAFVRLCSPNGGAAVEVRRGNAWHAFPQWLQQYLEVNGRLSQREIVRTIDDGMQGSCGIVIPIGIDAEGGLVAAASSRPDFPSEIDGLLLSVAANHAATAFRMARLVDGHRRAEAALRESEQELRKARDELETKVAERTAELQRSEAYLAEAQRLSHVGSFGWDVCSGKLFWSAETYRIFECDPADPLTVAVLFRKIHPQDRVRVQQTIDCAVQEKADLDFEYRLLMPGERLKSVHVVGHPVFDESGNLVEFAGTVMDVTERRRAEDERQALAHANRITTMGQLTASIAHEINQPIAAMVIDGDSGLRWLDKQPPDLEEIRAIFGRIVKVGTQAGDVIGRIRALIAKAPPRKDRLDINNTISDVISVTRTEMQRNGVSLQIKLAPDLPLVQGDRVQLQQVMLNLILNAIQAMGGVRDGTRELLICTGKAEPAGVIVAVQDTGPGLDPEALHRLFEAFYTTKPDGMGMGLAICRSIIEDHGGRVRASANRPRGAVFEFALPTDQGQTAVPELAGQMSAWATLLRVELP